MPNLSGGLLSRCFFNQARPAQTCHPHLQRERMAVISTAVQPQLCPVNTRSSLRPPPCLTHSKRQRCEAQFYKTDSALALKWNLQCVMLLCCKQAEADLERLQHFLLTPPSMPSPSPFHKERLSLPFCSKAGAVQPWRSLHTNSALKQQKGEISYTYEIWSLVLIGNQWGFYRLHLVV